MTRGRWVVVGAITAALVALVVVGTAWVARSMSRTSSEVAAGFARDEAARLRTMLTAQVPQVDDSGRIADAVRLAAGSNGEVRSVTFVDRQVDAVIAVTRTASASTIETAPAATVTLCFRYVRSAGSFDFSSAELDRCP